MQASHENDRSRSDGRHEVGEDREVHPAKEVEISAPRGESRGKEDPPRRRERPRPV